MQEAARLPVYKQYLATRPQVPSTIEWTIIEFAMQKFSTTDRVRIQKIIHDWCPTRVSPGHYPSHAADKLCPSCHHYEEIPEHLLCCDHPTCRKIRQKFYHKFFQMCAINKINPNLTQMWWLGMISTNPNTH